MVEWRHGAELADGVCLLTAACRRTHSSHHLGKGGVGGQPVRVRACARVRDTEAEALNCFPCIHLKSDESTSETHCFYRFGFFFFCIK